jgi:hypothetical protein
VLLYDIDTNKPEEDIGNLLIRRMTKNNDNTIFKIGIENLLVIPSEFNTSVFYKQKSKIDDYSAESVITELDKTMLCSNICENVPPENQKEILEKIKTEIFKILHTR